MSKYRYIKRNPFTKKSGGRVVRRRKRNTLAKRVRKLERTTKPELLHYTRQEAGIDTYTTPVVSIIHNNQDGQCLVKSLQIRGVCQMETAQATDHLVRVVLVLCKTPVDAATDPTWANVFHDTAIYTLRALDEDTNLAPRFKILMDKVYHLHYPQDTGYAKRYQYFEYFKKWENGLPQIYESGTSKYTKNGIYLMVMSTAATTVIDTDLYYRYRFTDSD